MAAIVTVHVGIIFLLVTQKMIKTPAAGPPVQLIVIEQPRREPFQLRIPTLALTAPRLSAIAAPDIDVPMPQPPTPEALPTGQNSDLLASSVESPASVESSGSSGSNMTLTHRVQPIYSDQSVRAKEQGYVTAAMLVDEHGRVRKVEVTQSSGYRRLDQSVVDALRQWRFRRLTDKTPSAPVWTALSFGFHLAAHNRVDLSSLSLTLARQGPALIEQIREAAMADTHSPRGAEALRLLIEAIGAVASEGENDSRAPLTPVQLVGKLGAARTVRFLSFEKHGLELDEEKSEATPPRHVEQSRWEFYKVAHDRGESEWLVAVTRAGTITDAQALNCEGACPDL